MRARCGENNPLRTPAAARRPSNAVAAPGCGQTGHSQYPARIKDVLATPLKSDTVLRSDIGRASAIIIIRMVGFGPSRASWLDPPLTPPPAGWTAVSGSGDTSLRDWWLAVDGFANCHI